MVPAPVAVPIGGVFGKVKRGVARFWMATKILVIPALAQIVNATSHFMSALPRGIVATCVSYTHSHYL